MGQRWSGIIKGAILEGDWEAAGQIACPIIFQNGERRYEQHCWKILQQAKKSVTDHGIKSEATRVALDWIFTADTSSPIDSTNLARLLLTPSQFFHWEQEWKRLAQMEANRPQQQNEPLYGINPDMLTGSGVYGHLQVQLQYPLLVHHLSA